jgi:hypothetical protein
LRFGARVEQLFPLESLQAQGRSLREISRPLARTRNTVRRILHEPVGKVTATPPWDDATLSRLKAAFTRARDNIVRVRELLADDGLDVPHSSLTRRVTEAELRGPPRRAGEYEFVPGQEMRYDTSPHRVRFASAYKPVTVQCAAWCWHTHAGCSSRFLGEQWALSMTIAGGARDASGSTNWIRPGSHRVTVTYRMTTLGTPIASLAALRIA